ncbi:MAG: RagB/SusD family nutrient uptake outer membrane protein [Prolixibacteraceae bacterium]|nr:RagB/SusD family nutrient uptake outer membrane protein [Prolixibacteraceae bacterium]
MNTKINTIICAALTILILAFITSCSDDFFDQQAGNRIEPDKHYQSITDVEVSLYGAIIPLQSIMPNLIMLDGLRSDLMDVTPNSSSYLKEINDHNMSVDNPYINCSDFYKSIVNLNEVMVNLPIVYENDPKFDDYYMKYVTGSIIGMRAWIYLTLSRLYGEVLWIDRNLTTLEEAQGMKYMSKSVLIDTLINQLQPYIHTDELLGELKIPYYVNNKAMLGELYLEKNDYQNAVLYLKMACENSESTSLFKIDRTFYRESWMNIFISSANDATEVFSVMPYNLTEKQANPLRLWMENEYVVKPTSYIVNAYNSQVGLRDFPGDENRGIGITIDTLRGTSELYIKKYSLDDGDAFYSSDIIISRAAGVHLMLAEALNRIGEHNLALILLNNGINGEKTKPAGWSNWSSNYGVRGRAYVTPREIPEGLTEAQITERIEDYIIDEGVLELAYEGHRWFDLMRIAERRGWNGYLAEKVAAKFSDASKANTIRDKLRDRKNWYLPMEK